MPIHVHSEIGPLRRVLLHRPGRELEHLVPQELERLLFDDIPYLALAQQEHDTFASILRAQGCEVVYLEDYAAETLRLRPELREGFIRRFLQEGGAMAQAHFKALFGVLMEIDDDLTLIRRTMSGLTAEELEGRLEEGPLTRLTRESRHFVLDPIPNLYFTRDPFASIGCGASVHRMFSATRRRETIYADLILRRHPDFAGMPLWYDRGEPFPIEGGDILNLSDRVLAIGLSQRTSPEGIERLARNLFASNQSTVETILVLDIPSVRAFMHPASSRSPSAPSGSKPCWSRRSASIMSRSSAAAARAASAPPASSGTTAPTPSASPRARSSFITATTSRMRSSAKTASRSLRCRAPSSPAAAAAPAA